MPEQQREPGEQQRAGDGRGLGRRRVQRLGRGRQSAGHAAAGHEDEVEAVEEVQLDGLGRAVAARVARLHLAAADVHGREQPRTTAEGPSLHVEKTVQHHATELFEESTLSQVGIVAVFVVII